MRTYRQDEIPWGLYTEFDAEAAEYLTLLDSELQAIKKALMSKCPDLDLSTVLPIRERIIQQYGRFFLRNFPLHLVSICQAIYRLQ